MANFVSKYTGAQHDEAVRLAGELDGKVATLSEEIANQRNEKPLVYIDGAIPTTKDDVLAELTYEHGAERWHAYIEIKCQGSSSMSYPKKNFTVKLYEDVARSVKMNRKMFGWPVASNKFVLKANYIDHTHARNIINARLWGEVVASRPDYDSLPEELRNSPNNGAIDGYPIIVYTNGTYQGLYTWNIGKDPWMVGMDEDNPDHVFLCNEQNTNTTDSPSNFRAWWDGNEFYWKVEIGKGSEAVTAAFNNLVNCAMNDDDAAFRANITKYLDVQSAIDYYLHQYVICGLDGLGKNMPLIKFSPLLWFMTAYDMDATWLLWWTGGSFVPANYACPEQYQESRNLLFERIASVYGEEMAARYAELRKTVYSYANIMSHFEHYYDHIGKETYADDLVPYPDIPSAEHNNIWQLRNAVRDRLAYCDTKLLGAGVTAVSYIESDGESWIDTGLQVDADMVIEAKIFNPENEKNYEGYFGTYGSEFSFTHTAGAPTTWVNVSVNGTNHTDKYYPNGGFKAGTTNDLMLDLSLTGENDWVSTRNLLLFAKLNTAGTAPDVPGTFRLYDFKVTRKSTNEVLLDLTPAVDNAGVPGMYDSVSKKMFYNAGTGAFAVPAY